MRKRFCRHFFLEFMSESSTYLLRWRGRQFGPCSVKEINRRLDEHEIGMGHEIQYENRWIRVEEFLRAIKSTAKASDSAARQSPAAPSGAGILSAKGPAEAATVTRPEPAALPFPITPRHELAAEPEPLVASPRRRVIFATLAILAGFLGLHNFYARHWLTGVIQLLVSVASSLLGFGIIAPWIWAMVEAVFVRKDGHELVMS